MSWILLIAALVILVILFPYDRTISKIHDLCNQEGKYMFYGVYGRNGAGIYYNWDKVMQSMPYISGVKTKKFKTMDDAVDFVKYGLVNFYRVIPEDKLNVEVLYRKYNFFSRIHDLML